MFYIFCLGFLSCIILDIHNCTVLKNRIDKLHSILHTIKSSNVINPDVISLVCPVPADIYKVSEDITVNEGSNLTLSCLASGRPDPAINWRLLNPSGENCYLLSFL